MKLVVDPFSGLPVFTKEELRVYSQSGGGGGTAPETQYITTGTSGITTIRMRSTPGGLLYDLTITDAGAVVTTLYTPPGP